MGSPLAPTFTNLFLGYNEQNSSRECNTATPTFYKWYEDKILAIFNNEFEANCFLDYLNMQHDNIDLTMNKGQFGDKLTTSMYRKELFTALLTNYVTPISCKLCLIRYLMDIAYKINSTL